MIVNDVEPGWNNRAKLCQRPEIYKPLNEGVEQIPIESERRKRLNRDSQQTLSQKFRVIELLEIEFIRKYIEEAIKNLEYLEDLSIQKIWEGYKNVIRLIDLDDWDSFDDVNK